MLAKHHYKKLKQINRTGGTKATDYAKHSSVYSFLASKGYILKSPYQGYEGYIITEEGKLELELCRMERYHFWIPTVLSIIAIIVSIIAIILKV
ncbi:MAG: hypothetical protein E7290_09415 [Lachnospiraceae bacterium]|nr:hypothetical protein [Lachnospiraceae bacterium]